MTDDQLLLAYALIDDELDARQRQLAEADPEVMREVAALRAQRAELQNVTPASEATRTAAITAALDAWSPVTSAPLKSATASDGSIPSIQLMPPEAMPHSGGSVTAIHPRQARSEPGRRSSWASSTRLLGAAAAVVGLGLAGLVIAVGRGDRMSDSASKAARDAPMASGATGTASNRPSAAPADAASTLDEAALSESAAASEYAMSEMSVAASEADVVESATDVVIVPMPTLQFTESDLKSVVDRLSGLSTNTSDPASVANQFSCNLPTSPSIEIDGETTASNDDPLRPTVTLIIVTDETNGMAYAFDAETCLAVQSAELLP